MLQKAANIKNINMNLTFFTSFIGWKFLYNCFIMKQKYIFFIILGNLSEEFKKQEEETFT